MTGDQSRDLQCQFNLLSINNWIITRVIRFNLWLSPFFFILSLEDWDRKSLLNCASKERPVEKRTRSTFGWKYSSAANYEAAVRWHKKQRVIPGPVKAGRGLSKVSASSALAAWHLTGDRRRKQNQGDKWIFMAWHYGPLLLRPGWRLGIEMGDSSNITASSETYRCPRGGGGGGCLKLNCRNKVPIISVIGSNKAARLLSAPPWLLHIFKSPI